jgi:hypothetical protein
MKVKLTEQNPQTGTYAGIDGESVTLEWSNDRVNWYDKETESTSGGGYCTVTAEFGITRNPPTEWYLVRYDGKCNRFRPCVSNVRGAIIRLF